MDNKRTVLTTYLARASTPLSKMAKDCSLSTATELLEPAKLEKSYVNLHGAL